MGILYQRVARPILFSFDSERIHNVMTALGGGLSAVARTIPIATHSDSLLYQTIHGIQFKNPIGLAAGFDYQGKLPYVLPYLGFGFGTVGTITHRPYEGNPRPRLGRIVSARALVVNKGFKNNGIEAMIEKFRGQKFSLPVGLSIGKTNSRAPMSQAEAVADILESFTIAEDAPLPFTHYELNISCPNLFGQVEFNSLSHLHALLKAVTELGISRPIFVKMPTTESNEHIKEMLACIAEYKVQGVIFGNLRNDRNDPSINPQESAKYPKGNLAGKPTEARSNELIALAYRTVGNKLTIVGCGGIFTAKDAYKKIRLGASLVQLVTGLIYEGPFLPRTITKGLHHLLIADGFKNIQEAVGASHQIYTK